MKSEDEPVTPDELVVRLIWHQFLRPNEPVPVQPVAFKPRDDETEGISVFRLACLSDPRDALAAMLPEKRDRYAIAVLPVAELLALGLSVKPAKIESVPGHAVIPELNITAVKAGRLWWKELQLKLVELAAKNQTPPAEPKT
jgi:hypothetical protein